MRFLAINCHLTPKTPDCLHLLDTKLGIGNKKIQGPLPPIKW